MFNLLEMVEKLMNSVLLFFFFLLFSDRSVHVGSAGLPPADWLHNLLRLQSETVESKTQRKLLDEFGDIPVTTVRQRNRKPSFKKLKSWNALRAATATPPAAANTSRRCSF